jgi:putative oxidoreductase
MATTKTTQPFAIVARILLGLIFVVFGLNFFFHFLHSAPPDPTSKAGLFLGGLFASGYFFIFLKVLEVLYGLLLLADLYTPLVLILLFPISINIVLFHTILAPSPSSLIIAWLLFALNVYLAWINRAVYAPLLKRNAKTTTDEPVIAAS